MCLCHVEFSPPEKDVTNQKAWFMSVFVCVFSSNFATLNCFSIICTAFFLSVYISLVAMIRVLQCERVFWIIVINSFKIAKSCLPKPLDNISQFSITFFSFIKLLCLPFSMLHSKTVIVVVKKKNAARKHGPKRYTLKLNYSNFLSFLRSSSLRRRLNPKCDHRPTLFGQLSEPWPPYTAICWRRRRTR